MSEVTSLKAEVRKRSGGAHINRMRKEGSIPAVVYGKSAENLNLKVDGRVFGRLLDRSATDNILVQLDIEGQSQLALVKSVQHDYLRDKILHVDFHAVSDDEIITAEVPVVLRGEAVGTRAGGQLEQVVLQLRVKCLPKDLPEKVGLDVHAMKIGDKVYVGDLEFPEGVAPILDSKVVVALVAETRVSRSAAVGGDAADGKKKK